MCRLRNIALRVWQTDGQSDPYVSLCFAGDTKSCGCVVVKLFACGAWDGGSIPGHRYDIIDWLSPGSKSRYGWKIAYFKSEVIPKTKPTNCILQDQCQVMSHDEIKLCFTAGGPVSPRGHM